MRTTASCLLLLGLLVLADEPTFRGKPVSYWIEQLQKGEPAQRVLAVKALKAFGPQTDGVLPALTDALADKEGDVRLEAVSAFADLGLAAAPAVGGLAQALKDSRADVRTKAATVLGRLGATARPAASALADALDDSESAVQAAACAALEALALDAKERAPIATRAARSKSPSARAWGLKQLAGLGADAKDAEEVICEALSDNDPQIRKAAAEALCRIGASEKAIPALSKAIGDKETSVASAAVTALSTFGEKAMPPLLALLQEDQANRWQLAARAIGEMGDKAKAALPELRKMLHDRDEEFRKRGASTLARMGEPGRRVLQEAAKDKDAAVAALAQRVLKGEGSTGPFASRVRGDLKERALSRGGGTRETEQAVMAALGWLARHQSLDGGWKCAAFTDQCQGAKCEGQAYPDYDVAVTGLALLAFLGAGMTTDSDDSYDGSPKFGPAVERAIQWLVVIEGKDGCFDAKHQKLMYNQAIATMAMAEAYGVVGDEALREPAQKAVNFLTSAQNPHAAWRYTPLCGENDTSVTSWCVQALHSAELAGLEVDGRATANAWAFVKRVTDQNYGKVGYQSIEDAGVKVIVPGKNEDYAAHEAMAAAGMLVRAYVDANRVDPMLDLAAKLLSGDLPLWDKAKRTNDYYYWYYGTMALYQFDGPDSGGEGRTWAGWNRAMIQALAKHQIPSMARGGCARGSWDSDDRWGFEGGAVYATAINALTLEVYYRYPNAFTKPK